MIRHIFRLMWNRKRKNALLIIEIFAAFLVLFALSSYIIYNYNNYVQPLGFEYENVWAIRMDWPADENDFVYEKQEQMKRAVLSMPQVEMASLASWSTPFDGGGSRTSVEREGERVIIDWLSADIDFFDTFQMKITDGRKLQPNDTLNGKSAFVINQFVADKGIQNDYIIGDHPNFFGEDEDDGLNVIGVFPDFRKYGEFTEKRGAILELHRKSRWKYSTLLVRVKPGSTAEVEERMLKTVSNIGKTWNIKLTRLSNDRQKSIDEQMIEIYAFSLIAGFLIINVALGLFGVLWYNIQQRKSEIGLRRVIGALAKQIQGQIVTETVVMTIIGLTLGVFFAIQVPILNLYKIDLMVFFYAIGFSVIFISLISVICSAYPSFLASKIAPAITLHED
jgi:putative ABC transport system permease protein